MDSSLFDFGGADDAADPWAGSDPLDTGRGDGDDAEAEAEDEQDTNDDDGVADGGGYEPPTAPSPHATWRRPRRC